MLQEGSKAQRVFAAVAEFPGVKVTSREVADECELPLHDAANHLWNLHQRGHIRKESQGQGRRALYWVDA